MILELDASSRHSCLYEIRVGAFGLICDSKRKRKIQKKLAYLQLASCWEEMEFDDIVHEDGRRVKWHF